MFDDSAKQKEEETQRLLFFILLISPLKNASSFLAFSNSTRVV